MEEVQLYQPNVYKGGRYWINNKDGVKSVRHEVYGENLLPSNLPTAQKFGKPNSALLPYLIDLEDKYEEHRIRR